MSAFHPLRTVRIRPIADIRAMVTLPPYGVHLMLKSRFPMRAREDARPYKTYSSHTGIVLDFVKVPRGVRVNSFETKSAVVALGSVDTAVTAALTDADTEVLIDWFRRGHPGAMGFFVADSGAMHLEGRVEQQAVSSFVRRCGPAS